MKSTLPVAGAAFACLLLGLVSCTMAPQAIAPRATVDRFLDFYFQEYGSGVLDTAQRVTLRPLLTDGLTEALERAAVAERCANEQARGQEPPLIQGDIFSSLFEKATAVVGIDQGATEGQRLTYRLHFEWREPGAAEASVLWTDEVTLQAVDGRWLIDDFVHGGPVLLAQHVDVVHVPQGSIRLDPLDQHRSDAASNAIENSRSRTERRTQSPSR